MKSMIIALIIVLSLGVMGCSSSYTLHVNRDSNKMHIIFSKGSNVKVGDIFVFYKATVVNGSGGGHDHGGSTQHLEKYVVGKVQVTSVVNSEFAYVKLLSGSVENGVTIEKAE